MKKNKISVADPIIKVNIDGIDYEAIFSRVGEPDLEREDHGIFMLYAECELITCGGRQGLQILLDEKDEQDIIQEKDYTRSGRYIPKQAGKLLMDYIDFWGGSFNHACGNAFVLRLEEDGYIKGLLSVDMNKSFIIADYWDNKK
jgi:hypothetical protein